MFKSAITLTTTAASFAALAFAQTAPLAPVEQTVLARDVFATGLLDRDAGALGSDLWRGADGRVLAVLLAAAPARPASPSIGVLARRVLLSAGDAPQGADASLGGAKLAALVRLGFIDEAREIESLAIGGKSDAGLLEALASADLLSGDAAAACTKVQRIQAPRDNPYGAKLRGFCYAIAGELDAADLALGLLRERGGLTTADEAILLPMASGGKPKPGSEPVDAVQYAALRAAGMSVSLSSGADAGLHKAVAEDATAPWPQRLLAAKRASAMGVMSAAQLKELFGAAPLEVAMVAGGALAFRQSPDDPMALAAAFQQAKTKSAPEFARDRAGLVAGAISAARDFETLFAASALFAEEVRGFDGMLVSAGEAEAFALARLALGDVTGAEKWLTAGAAGGAGAGAPSDIPALIAAAKSGARPAGIQGEASAIRGLATFVDAAIEAAAERIAGQGALTALAASGAAAAGDPVAEVLLSRGLETAGLQDLARRRGAERLLQDRYARFEPAPSASDAALSPPPPPGGDLKKPTPRVKPAPSR
ncbi:MAG: hypothetical protein U5J99_09800 [Parvularculaceae bacterium]|nr:hypothetical protein [Parvularculaceae bacterium]